MITGLRGLAVAQTLAPGSSLGELVADLIVYKGCTDAESEITQAPTCLCG